jgi:hypothetical protein
MSRVYAPVRKLKPVDLSMDPEYSDHECSLDHVPPSSIPSALNA